MNFKHEKDEKLFLSLSPILIMIYADLYYYARSRHNVELVVTSTISTLEEDKKLGRTSSSHRQGRSLDVRTRDIDIWIIQDIMRYINEKKAYVKYKYMSNSGSRRLAYLHDNGNGMHMHLAIHSQFKNRIP